jgi:hypothetical protein
MFSRGIRTLPLVYVLDLKLSLTIVVGFVCSLACQISIISWSKNYPDRPRVPIRSGPTLIPWHLHPPPSIPTLTLAMHLSTPLTLLATYLTSTTLASEWPIPIPQSLLPTNRDQRAYSLNPPRPENVRLIQTVEGKYQWTGDIEALLRDGVRLMDVFLPFA